MFDKKYKKLFTESEGFLLLLSCFLFIIIGGSFIRECIEHQPIIKILTSSIWMIAILGLAFLNWRKLFILEPTEECSKTSQETKLSEIITISVILIPVIVLFIIVCTNHDFNQSYIITVPRFAILEDWANILLGLGIIFQTLEEIVESKKKIIQQILLLFQTIAILSGFILYMMYASNLT